MKWGLLLATLVLFTSVADAGNPTGKIYRWVDAEGKVHYSKRVPPEATEYEKAVLNDRGIEIGTIDGRKSEEELAEEARLAALEEAKQARIREDQALLNTYLSVEEIIDHMSRRIELWQAQARVTELYLRNLERRHGELDRRKMRFSPYSDNPDAPAVDPELLISIEETVAAIDRHTSNLAIYKREEEAIKDKFLSDIERFKQLKRVDED